MSSSLPGLPPLPKSLSGLLAGGEDCPSLPPTTQQQQAGFRPVAAVRQDRRQQQQQQPGYHNNQANLYMNATEIQQQQQASFIHIDDNLIKTHFLKYSFSPTKN